MLPQIVERHADELASLWDVRVRAARAPHFSLRDLLSLDHRVDANIDGLTLAGDEGWAICRQSLGLATVGDVFAHAVVAIHGGRTDRIFDLLSATEGAVGARQGLVSGLGWMSFSTVRAQLSALLEAREAAAIRTGLMAAALHRHDPGESLRKAFESSHPRVRAAALRAAGKLGLASLGPTLRCHLGDSDHECRFRAAVALTLFGFDRDALDVLIAETESLGTWCEGACRLAARRLSLAAAERWIQSLGAPQERARVAIFAAGARGAPELVPWLIDHMGASRTARIAGAAFTVVTGTDLRRENLYVDQPEAFGGGPNEDPSDETVDMDPDEHLSWPKVEDIRALWERNAGRFVRGTRYLLGAPISSERCESILREGRQPHRAAAAAELVLNNPGPLFATRAPAFRQLTRLGFGRG